MAFTSNGFNFNQSILDGKAAFDQHWADVLNRAGLGMESVHERNAHNFPLDLALQKPPLWPLITPSADRSEVNPVGSSPCPFNLKAPLTGEGGFFVRPPCNRPTRPWEAVMAALSCQHLREIPRGWRWGDRRWFAPATAPTGIWRPFRAELDPPQPGPKQITTPARKDDRSRSQRPARWGDPGNAYCDAGAQQGSTSGDYSDMAVAFRPSPCRMPRTRRSTASRPAAAATVSARETIGGVAARGDRQATARPHPWQRSDRLGKAHPTIEAAIDQTLVTLEAVESHMVRCLIRPLPSG